MNTTRTVARRTARTGATTAAALVLAATGGITAASAADTPALTTVAVRAADPTDDHNQADVTFAQGMIPHHRQAIVMSRMARAHDASPEVKALALRIQKAQQPEIDTMAGWLEAWGEKVPRGMGAMDDMNGMGRDGDDATSMPGMMHGQRMRDLDGTAGRAFDTMFLTMMIEHHEGAIDMARTEQKQGSYTPAKDLAADIIKSQTAEIAQMRTMLTSR
ncbi:DUF305 domain-containing protein [Streptomyces sp. BR123]|uniref:DUF305 domain-containing protein n=1 Tax=Streptomyces sp. BR123 TaxID=2749828 RepID=UPI0015C458A0|nr:DUF305 domain-containing protein [Streptomyces sp. BR123]NXY93607.1 DUF305 domain-containing protein [Streptomyces sp. BR123]